MNKRGRRRVRPEAARAFLVLIILGVCIYIALATTAGNYIAEKVIAPIFRSLSERSKPEDQLLSKVPTASVEGSVLGSAGDGTDPAPDEAVASDGNSLSLLPGGEPSAPASADGETPVSAPSASSGESSEEVKLDAFTSYALQMGAFSNEENAKSEADKLRTRGAAGYIYHKDLYRVFASIYQNEADAQAVRKQLLDSEGIEASVYVIQAPGAAFRVTASAEGLASVKSAFQALQTARDELYTLCTDLDRKQISQAEARTELKSLAEDARKPVEALNGTGEVGTALQGELKKSADELEKVASMDGSAIAFSTEMKFALVRQTCAYAELMNEITGASA